MTTKQIVAAALKLPPKRRAELASRLIQSLEREEQELSPAEWEKLWVKECERRLAELRKGKAEEIDGDEVFERAREILSSTASSTLSSPIASGSSL